MLLIISLIGAGPSASPVFSCLTFALNLSELSSELYSNVVGVESSKVILPLNLNHPLMHCITCCPGKLNPRDMVHLANAIAFVRRLELSRVPKFVI